MQGDWRSEFGEDYDVPCAVREAVAAGILSDDSWGNDAAPSFSTKSGRYVLWCDHPDPEQREARSAQECRYTVCVNTYCDAYEGEEYREFYRGDDAAEAVKRMGVLELIGPQGLNIAADMAHEREVSRPPGDERGEEV